MALVSTNSFANLGNSNTPLYASYENDLQRAKQEKLEVVANKKALLANGANLDPNTYTEMPDGSLESNKNKVWNSLSLDDLSSVYSNAVSQYGAVTDPVTGKTHWLADGTEVPEGIKLQSMYAYNDTMPGDDGKLGVARGDLPNSDYRYVPGKAQAEGYKVGSKGYGWTPGGPGVDVNNKMLDVKLPYDIAMTLEGIVHGNEYMLQQRVVQPGNTEVKAAYGSGSSEYYKDLYSTLLNRRSDSMSKEDAIATLNSYVGNKGRVEGDVKGYLQAIKEHEADNMGVVGRLGNTLAGVGKSFVQNLALDTADWVGETLKRQTGWGWDLGTEEEKADMASNVFGYNQVLAERGQQEASKYVSSMWEAATKEDVDFKVSDAWNLFKTVMTTPEMIGESVGYVAAMLPGVWGKAAMTASKAAQGVAAAKAVNDTAKVAELMPVLQAAQKQAAMGKTIGALGLVNVATGDVNDQIDQYMKNNEGVAPSAGDIMFRMMPIAVTSAALDKFSMAYTVGAAKSVMGVAKEATTELVETLPAAAKNQLWGKVGTAALGISKAAGVEAAQEYTQTMAEIFNKQYDTEKYGDDVGKILTSDENIVEALTASAFGAGQGAQMKAASPLWDATKAGAAAVGSGIAAAGDAIAKGKEALDDLNDDAKMLVDTNGKKVTAEDLDKDLEGILEVEGLGGSVVTDAHRAKAAAMIDSVPDDLDSFMTMFNSPMSAASTATNEPSDIGSPASKPKGFGSVGGSFGTSLEAMRGIEKYLEQAASEGKVSEAYVNELHQKLVDRSSGSEVSDTMQKVIEVKEAAKKLNEAYKVIIEDAPEGSVQSGTGKSNKTMSEVTREVADDVQKWFNVAIKADSVINSNASAESKRVAMTHKALIAEHLQRLTSSQKSKRDQIKNAEEDAVNTINQMVLARAGNDVGKANDRVERAKALVALKDELQKLYVANAKNKEGENKSQTDLANQYNPVEKGYVVARYGTRDKGSFIIPLHMVVEKLYAEEFSNADGSYSISDRYTVPVTSKNHVRTGSAQYTGVLRSVDTEIKALETISRYVAGSPILTREDRSDIAKAGKQEQEELVATSVVDDTRVIDNEYADLERMADTVRDEGITFDYDDSVEYLSNNPEIFENVVEDTATEIEDRESAVTEVDEVEYAPVVVEDVFTDDFTAVDIPGLETSLKELVELRDSMDSKEIAVPEEEVESGTTEEVSIEVKRRLVEVLTNNGSNYQSKLRKAKETVSNSLRSLSLFEDALDEQVMEILSRGKEEVKALFYQYREELKTAKTEKPTTAKQAASKNVTAVLKDLRDKLTKVKADIALANKDIRNLRAESRNQGWTSLWPFTTKVAIELGNGYYATKTGGITYIKNGKNNLEGRGYTVTEDLSSEGEAYKFLEQFRLEDGVASENMKPNELRSSNQVALERDIKDIENYLEESRSLERREELEAKIKEIKETRRRALATGKYEQLVLDFDEAKPEGATTESTKPTPEDKVREAKKLMVSKKDWVEDLFEELSEVSIDSKEGFNIVYNKLHSLLTVMTDVKDEKEKSIIMALQDKLVQLKDSCR